MQVASWPMVSGASFLINVFNDGTRDLDGFVLTDTLPAGLELVDDSWSAAQGEVQRNVAGQLIWRGEALELGGSSSLVYDVELRGRSGGLLVNRAQLEASDGQILQLEASIQARSQILLPWLGNERELDP